jgi:membrane-bound lytic murein transglycosylase D
MRTFLLLIILLTTIQAWALNPIPRVPATIEIANIKLKITAEAQREIQKDVDAIRASDKYFQIKLDRINLYFPLIERILKEEGVPDDIKYLAVQESALISDAVSSAGAVGYWQMKDFTAREVGLRVDGKIDERKNIVAASHGASKYFIRNNYYVKNWIYAVNAYMTGPTGVKPYLDEKDIGSDKMVISGKTHWYVKRFIAHVIAYKDEVGAAHTEGLKLAEYEKGKNQTLENIAKELKVDEELLKTYNKWLIHGKIPDDKTYTVIVPMIGRLPSNFKESDKQVHAPLSRKIEEPKAKSTGASVAKSSQNVFIKRNDRRAVMATDADNVVSLALKANILSRQLIKFNDMNDGQTIKSGEVYYAQSKRNRSEISFHIAQYGESLWEISQKYSVKTNKILKKNRMTATDELKPGRVLWMRSNRPKDTPIEYKDVKKIELIKPRKVLVNPPIAPSTATKEPVKPIVEETIEEGIEDTPLVEASEETPAIVQKETPKMSNTHIVQSGETLWAISRKYEVSISEILEWNSLADSTSLKPGQELTITRQIQNLDNSKPVMAASYTAQPGDTLFGVARTFGLTLDEIKSLNNKESNELAVGEVLRVN